MHSEISSRQLENKNPYLANADGIESKNHGKKKHQKFYDFTQHAQQTACAKSSNQSRCNAKIAIALTLHLYAHE